METAELLEKIKNVDIEKDVNLFYSLLWAKINFMTFSENKFLMERSAKGIGFSPLTCGTS